MTSPLHQRLLNLRVELWLTKLICELLILSSAYKVSSKYFCLLCSWTNIVDALWGKKASKQSQLLMSRLTSSRATANSSKQSSMEAQSSMEEAFSLPKCPGHRSVTLPGTAWSPCRDCKAWENCRIFFLPLQTPGSSQQSLFIKAHRVHSNVFLSLAKFSLDTPSVLTPAGWGTAAFLYHRHKKLNFPHFFIHSQQWQCGKKCFYTTNTGCGCSASNHKINYQSGSVVEHP